MMLLTPRRFVLIVGLCLLAGPLATVTVRTAAGDFVVNSALDAVDVNPGDGVCETTPGGGVCTLRAAIQESNALGGPHVITLPGATFPLTIAGASENAAATGDLDIGINPITINGAGASATIIDAKLLDRVFDLAVGANLVLNDVTLQNGNARGDNGGCVNVTGARLTLVRVIVKGCTALFGGGIEGVGSANVTPTIPSTIVVTDSTITQNAAAAVASGQTPTGGGLDVFGSSVTVTISRTTFSGNTAADAGGAISSFGGAAVTIANATLSGNSATNTGGAIFQESGLTTVTNVTIASNTSSSGALFAFGGLIQTRNSIVANNIGPTTPNCAFTAGTIGDLGNNVEFPGTDCGFVAASDRRADPLLGALAANGGPTQTQALGAGSPAINAGDAATCAAVPVSNLDQRGTFRNGACDIGAYEFGGYDVSSTALYFGGTKVSPADPLTVVTSCQDVAVTFTGASAVWTATVNQPWVQITNGAGNGNGRFTVCISDPGNSLGGAPSAFATITVSANTIGLPTTLPVNLRVQLPGPSAAPFGSFDTPASGATVAGSIAVTGWALDDIEVSRVEIWRDKVAGETGAPGPGPTTGKVFIADPLFIDGARPDVEALYPTTPRANRAGWGYLMLTWGLPNQGNGVFTIYAYAYDQEGHVTTLGAKTITSDNAHAVKPFGGIDAPTYGQVVTSSFFNFGWALTPNPNSADLRSCVIADGQVQVGIDSGPLVNVTYGGARQDIAAQFPNFSNSNNAGGAYFVDTTRLSNGVHQIGWLVTDSCGRADGVGSRFFSVLNGAAPSVAAAASVAVASASTPASAPSSTSVDATTKPVQVLRGSDATLVYPSVSGVRVVPIGQSERVEVQLPPLASGSYSGYQIVNGRQRPLPLGSSLDATTGMFYWQPAAGFLGVHDLAFVPSQGGGVVAVRAVIGTAVQAAIDTPQAGAVSSSFVVAGWAVDQAAAQGSGIDAVHVWAYPVGGGAPIFLGVAAHGGARTDIGAAFGDQFTNSSYSLAVNGLASGTYSIVVYPHSAITGDFRGAQVVQLSVR